MKRSLPAVLSFSFAFALLEACAPRAGVYPSLEIRDIERVSGSFEAGSTPSGPGFTPTPSTPATLASLASLTDTASVANRAFLAALPAARRSITAARGAAVGSENWAVAQVALASLESPRSQAMIALADLDRLYVIAATEGGALAEIGAARDRVMALVAQQDQEIAALAGQLR